MANSYLQFNSSETELLTKYKRISVHSLLKPPYLFPNRLRALVSPSAWRGDEFLQYSRPLTLDPNTAHRELCLSEGNRRVTHCDEYQSYPSHPDRFDVWEQVLCREGTCGRCYWEVEWSGEEVSVTVSYKRHQQTHLGKTQSKIQQRIQEREKELQELRKAVETLKSSAQTAVEDSERIFTEMIRSIERRRSEVKELIRDQEKAEVSRAEGLLKRLEEEIAELKRRDAELEQLSHTEDDIHFLKTFQSVSEAPESKDLSCISVNQGLSFEAVKKSVSSLKTQLENFCKEEVMKISASVTKVQAVLPPEPTTREDFLQYSCHFTLDPNTAYRHLHLSEGNRRGEMMRDELQSYPDHPERFDVYPQVLCREGVSGRCYWEVEWSGVWGVRISVSYKSISRRGVGNECGFGYNDQSWSLELYSSSSSFYHNGKETNLPLVASSRIGVYVDHRAGTLAFYSISDTMTLLHRVQTTFTHTLHPGFFLGSGSSVKLL